MKDDCMTCPYPVPVHGYRGLLYLEPSRYANLCPRSPRPLEHGVRPAYCQSPTAAMPNVNVMMAAPLTPCCRNKVQVSNINPRLHSVQGGGQKPEQHTPHPRYHIGLP